MAKHNWVKLKGEYERGEFSSIANFLESKGIPESGGIRSKTVGWKDEREKYQKEVEERAKSKAVETEAQIRARQAKSAKFLQMKALKALQKQVPQDAMESLNMLRTGMQEERKALDMDRNNVPLAGNINIAVLNTRYGKMLQTLNDDELKTVFEGLTNSTSKGAGGDASSDSLRDVAEEGEVVQD